MKLLGKLFYELKKIYYICTIKKNETIMQEPIIETIETIYQDILKYKSEIDNHSFMIKHLKNVGKNIYDECIRLYPPDLYNVNYQHNDGHGTMSYQFKMTTKKDNWGDIPLLEVGTNLTENNIRNINWAYYVKQQVLSADIKKYQELINNVNKIIYIKINQLDKILNDIEGKTNISNTNYHASINKLSDKLVKDMERKLWNNEEITLLTPHEPYFGSKQVYKITVQKNAGLSLRGTFYYKTHYGEKLQGDFRKKSISQFLGDYDISIRRAFYNDDNNGDNYITTLIKL